MGYQQYGIERELVERIKRKMQNPMVKEKIKLILQDVTKNDLQNPKKVRRFVHLLSKEVGVKLSEKQITNMIHFVMANKIDPKNTFHLIKLWHMFR